MTTIQKEIPWIATARQYLGLKEVPGKLHNKTILGWLRELKAWWDEDETPWCGTFVAAMLKQNGRQIISEWFRARSWEKAGTKLARPAYGCIVVFSRTGGGHVGFCVGEDEKHNLMILGGNQGNAVSISAFPRTRVLAYVWPNWADGVASHPDASRYVLPKFKGSQPLSKNEQ